MIVSTLLSLVHGCLEAMYHDGYGMKAILGIKQEAAYNKFCNL
jgi:hypothetical protein